MVTDIAWGMLGLLVTINFYISYKEAMKRLNLDDLQTRRTRLTLRFAKLNKTKGKLSPLFKSNPKTHMMKTRHEDNFTIMAYTKVFKIHPSYTCKSCLTN